MNFLLLFWFFTIFFCIVSFAQCTSIKVMYWKYRSMFSKHCIGRRKANKDIRRNILRYFYQNALYFYKHLLYSLEFSPLCRHHSLFTCHSRCWSFLLELRTLQILHKYSTDNEFMAFFSSKTMQCINLRTRQLFNIQLLSLFLRAILSFCKSHFFEWFSRFFLDFNKSWKIAMFPSHLLSPYNIFIIPII